MTNKPMLSVERVHCLKIHRKPFLDLESGGKTGEIRDCSDRDFQVGDNVILVMVDETGNPTPNELSRKITHVQTGYGLPDDLCVLSYESAPQRRGIVTLEQVLKAYDYASAHPHNYLRGTTNWCAAVAHSLNAEQPAPVAVVMPGRKCPSEYRDSSYTQTCMAGEYNRALDDVELLNSLSRSNADLEAGRTVSSDQMKNNLEAKFLGRKP
jgi:hypothetical protein